MGALLSRRAFRCTSAPGTRRAFALPSPWLTPSLRATQAPRAAAGAAAAARRGGQRQWSGAALARYATFAALLLPAGAQVVPPNNNFPGGNTVFNLSTCEHPSRSAGAFLSLRCPLMHALAMPAATIAPGVVTVCITSYPPFMMYRNTAVRTRSDAATRARLSY